jgi:hypothetical protein
MKKIGPVKNLRNTFDFFVLKKPKLRFVESLKMRLFLKSSFWLFF